ncbi:uncharacterized protein LOC121415012 [Lytechinus variegatus]|uniref:uncharacterized protein LOC121415012 n=1 Tax=Lytechinus variegatus TaxID=7654 RepID=UPI001BB173F0|nr:uncharacterized protein LOC121415012 [Lytechinus variegatus]
MDLAADQCHCQICHQKCSSKSNLNRHMKTHEAKTFKCERCGKFFTLKQNLDNHVKKHQRQDQAPTIRLYKPGEALLKPSLAAQSYEKFAKVEKIVVDKVWCDPVSAEALARSKAGEAWRGEVHLTFGKYLNKTFKWLIENDVGWMKFILVEHRTKKDTNPLTLWLKSTLWEYADQFPQVMCHIHSVLKKKKHGDSTTAPLVRFEEEYIEDVALLSHADDILQESDVQVVTSLTTAERLMKPATSTSASSTSASSSSSSSASYEGWQKHWDECMPAANLPWAKSDGPHGLFIKAGSRLVLKETMEFPPPPQHKFESVMPSMLSFFATRIFFWRPVGVLRLKIRCPNRECPAPSSRTMSPLCPCQQRKMRRSFLVWSLCLCNPHPSLPRSSTLTKWRKNSSWMWMRPRPRQSIPSKSLSPSPNGRERCQKRRRTMRASTSPRTPSIR